MQEKLTSYRTKMITIIILLGCCTIVLVLYQTSSFERGSTPLLKTIARKSPTTAIHYSQDGVHVAMVCANRPFNEMAVTSIKSIMFHHRKSYNLTFHIFTDADGEKLINSYFLSTVNVCTNFRIYRTEELLQRGKAFLAEHHLVNEHYSGIYAFSKALIHEVLPADVHHVLLIDTDVLFVDDVYSIWQQFELFRKNKTALGLVPWYPPVPVDYKYNGSNPDPFVAGVVLLNLDVCYSIGFTRLLGNITDIAYRQLGLRKLWTADQTLLSFFATYFPEHFVTLPCFVNGHTFHYLHNGATWKSSCSGQYPRNLHVVPSSNLRKRENYFASWYVAFKEMPVEWLSYCNMEKWRTEYREKSVVNVTSNGTKI